MAKRHSAIHRHLAKGFCAEVWIVAAIATHVPAESLADVHVADFTLHFLGYLGLSGVFLMTLRFHDVPWRRRLWLAGGILLVYSAVDESTQALVNRYACLTDWFANVAGIAAAVVLDGAIHFLRREGKKRRHNR